MTAIAGSVGIYSKFYEVCDYYTDLDWQHSAVEEIQLSVPSLHEQLRLGAQNAFIVGRNLHLAIGWEILTDSNCRTAEWKIPTDSNCFPVFTRS